MHSCGKTICVPAVTVEPDRNPQQCVDLHFSLSGRNIGRIKGYIFLYDSVSHSLRNPDSCKDIINLNWNNLFSADSLKHFYGYCLIIVIMSRI
jgi:hypothetical protein